MREFSELVEVATNEQRHILGELGVYVMASSVLGGMMNALGLTLPFAVYMGMS